jgi:hypothetical protein
MSLSVKWIQEPPVASNVDCENLRSLASLANIFCLVLFCDINAEEMYVIQNYYTFKSVY